MTMAVIIEYVQKRYFDRNMHRKIFKKTPHFNRKIHMYTLFDAALS